MDEDSWRRNHGGGIMEVELLRGNQSEDIWEASGNVWEASGMHLGGIWEASGRHLGGREASGASEASGTKS